MIRSFQGVIRSYHGMIRLFQGAEQCSISRSLYLHHVINASQPRILLACHRIPIRSCLNMDMTVAYSFNECKKLLCSYTIYCFISTISLKEAKRVGDCLRTQDKFYTFASSKG